MHFPAAFDLRIAHHVHTVAELTQNISSSSNIIQAMEENSKIGRRVCPIRLELCSAESAGDIGRELIKRVGHTKNTGNLI
jgi:hypothetical protein